jgi:ribonuclease HII
MAKPKLEADYTFEAAAARRGLSPICGIDEAGRGPWAGPVVAAAVILPPNAIPSGLADSKTLSKARREALFTELNQVAVVGIGRAEVAEIDRLNILAATMLAMARAVADLAEAPGHALVDGNRAPDLPCGLECLVKGDGRCLSIAAASIVAKVTRDREMAALAERFPGFGWERNAGYGTAEHRAGLARLGPNEMHRRSFAPILKLLDSRLSG